MPYPSLRDDGRCVVLDLHGARVEEALSLALRVVAAAQSRGRAQVRLIHGSSTTDAYGLRCTIKQVLRQALKEGRFAPYITQALATDTALILSLDITARPDPRKLQLSELWPR
jgi:hypothetical protein